MQLEQAASEQLSLVQNLTDAKDAEQLFKNMQVQLFSSKQFGPVSMRAVTVRSLAYAANSAVCICLNKATGLRESHVFVQSQNVAQLVMIPGIVTSAAKPKVSSSIKGCPAGLSCISFLP